MGRSIIKLDGKYLEWSSSIDAPITFGMTREEFTQHYLEEYGRSGIHDLEGRLSRADESGTSCYLYDSVDEEIEGNRAGKNESTLTKEQIIKFYITDREKNRTCTDSFLRYEGDPLPEGTSQHEE